MQSHLSLTWLKGPGFQCKNKKGRDLEEKFVITAGDGSDTSTPAISDCDLFPFYYHGDVSLAARMFEHLFEVRLISLHIDVLRIVTVCRPGTVCVGSTGLAVNNGLLCHGSYPPCLFPLSVP